MASPNAEVTQVNSSQWSELSSLVEKLDQETRDRISFEIPTLVFVLIIYLATLIGAVLIAFKMGAKNFQEEVNNEPSTDKTPEKEVILVQSIPSSMIRKSSSEPSAETKLRRWSSIEVRSGKNTLVDRPVRRRGSLNINGNVMKSGSNIIGTRPTSNGLRAQNKYDDKSFIDLHSPEKLERINETPKSSPSDKLIVEVTAVNSGTSPKMGKNQESSPNSRGKEPRKPENRNFEPKIGIKHGLKFLENTNTSKNTESTKNRIKIEDANKDGNLSPVIRVTGIRADKPNNNEKVISKDDDKFKDLPPNPGPRLNK